MIKKIITTIIPVLSSMTAFTMLIAIIIYTLTNDSGHTSANPYWALLIFIPTTAFGIIGGTVSKLNQSSLWPSAICCIVGLIGCGFLIYLDKSNTLLQYEVWIDRGLL